VAVAADREHDQPSADHRIDRRECHDGKSDAGAGFRGAVDLPPYSRRRISRCRHGFRKLDGGQRATVMADPPAPAPNPSTAMASIASIIAPIGSGSPGW